jgi:hypothetical protein
MSVRLWKVSDFIDVSYQSSLLETIRTHRSEVDNRVSEETSPLMRWGTIFAANNYNKSKRTILLDHEIEQHMPEIKRFYYHDMPKLVSQLIGKNVYPADIRGNTCLQVLVYDEPGDAIGAHFDSSFFDKNQKIVTALLCLENRSTQQLCVDSSADIIQGVMKKDKESKMVVLEEYSKKEKDDDIKLECLDMKERDLYVFDHYIMRHAIRPDIKKGESRIVIAMVFAERPQSVTIHDYVFEKFKSLTHYRSGKVLLPADRLILILVSICILSILILLIMIVSTIVNRNNSEKPRVPLRKTSRKKKV